MRDVGVQGRCFASQFLDTERESDIMGKLMFDITQITKQESCSSMCHAKCP